jgi:pyridinium-3,5-bisthiocarboxylic acid mononucleotide nickel chelatase
MRPAAESSPESPSLMATAGGLLGHPDSPPRPMQLHLDPLGGAAGDMFAAAMLDAFPQHTEAAVAAASSLTPVSCRLVEHRDGLFAGKRFLVEEEHRHDHDHTHWRDIRRRIERSELPEGAKRHALGIFGLLAEAEAAVHGVPVDEVAFHEVGAADSIADIVAAGFLIDAIGASAWTVGPLPLGSGRVRTAHGPMPVPAPATARLLEGMGTIDDGIPGERVTPTGAAILRYVTGLGRPSPRPRTLRGSGTGFGTKRLPGISNCLRVLVFDEDAGDGAVRGHRELGVVEFEVDDQSAEELALGLERLRAEAGVHDVLQMPAFGKKGRMMTHVQVLARPDVLDAVIEACFRETTTIGLRYGTVKGIALPRRAGAVEVEGRRLRVKAVERPGGTTVKTEADDVAAVPGHAARARLRQEAVNRAGSAAFQDERAGLPKGED